MRFSLRFRHAQSRTSLTNTALAERLGVSPTMIQHYRAGRYLPLRDMAQRIAEVLDEPTLITLAAGDARCRMCDRPIPLNGTRRRYCSIECIRLFHKGVTPRQERDPRQEAIDAMCLGCEPDGICRDDTCALRPFSPWSFVPLRRRTVA